MWADYLRAEPGLYKRVVDFSKQNREKRILAESYLLLGLLSQGKERAKWLSEAKGAAFASNCQLVHLAILLVEADDALKEQDQEQFEVTASRAFNKLGTLQLRGNLTGKSRQEQILGGVTYAFYGLLASYLFDPGVDSLECFKAAEVSALLLGKEEEYMGVKFGKKRLEEIKSLINQPTKE